MNREPRMIRLRSVLLAFVTVVVAFFAGVLVVRAVPGGATREALSFAGTLRQNGQPMIGVQALTFSFKKGGMAICAPVVMATPDAATGNFQVEIPIDKCPSTLFDGGDVVFDLSVGGNVIAGNQAINAVPYAKYADKSGSRDCPIGYTRDMAEMKYVVCKKGADEMVKVSTLGGSAFWVDRYEASLWDKADGSGVQFGKNANDFANITVFEGRLFALSRAGVMPSRAPALSWIHEACAASGKFVPSASEWLAAAAGTPPTVANGVNGACFASNMGSPRMSGGGTACVSDFGAQDMAGNLAEVVDDATFTVASAFRIQGNGYFQPPGRSFWWANSLAESLYEDVGFRCIIR